MMRRARPLGARSAARLVALVTAVAFAVSSGAAQNVTEPALKAAFIVNFARFTEWPGDVMPATSPLVACVMGDPNVATALTRAARDRMLSGHPVRVVSVAANGDLRSCHLLYLSGLDTGQTARVLSDLTGAPVLTIGDADEFSEMGGITRVFIENGQMRFNLNLTLARRSRLQLSSRLVALASHVNDEKGGGAR